MHFWTFSLTLTASTSVPYQSNLTKKLSSKNLSTNDKFHRKNNSKHFMSLLNKRVCKLFPFPSKVTTDNIHCNVACIRSLLSYLVSSSSSYPHHRLTKKLNPIKLLGNFFATSPKNARRWTTKSIFWKQQSIFLLEALVELPKRTSPIINYETITFSNYIHLPPSIRVSLHLILTQLVWIMNKPKGKFMLWFLK